MAVQIQLRGDVAAQWTSVNPILADRELALETDTGKQKIGNGSSSWNSLPYAVNATSITSAEYQSLVDRVSTNSATGGGGGSVTSAEVSAVSATAKAAIDVVSQALSVETTARLAKDDALSASIAELSTHLSTVSNAASNALSVANAASNAVSIVSAALAAEIATRAASVNQVSEQVSAEAAARAAADATLSAAITTVSIAAAAADTHANTASAAATSVDGRVATNSARMTSISAELASLVQIASAAATSADGHANAASAAATSVDGRVNSVVSTIISNALSMINAETQARVSSDAALAICIAATNSFLDGISARSVGNVSTKGLQSVVDALSNRISGVVGGAASVTSDELSVVNDRVSTLSGTVSTLIDRVSTNSALIVAADLHASTASAAATSVDGRVATNSARMTSVSAELASLVQIASLAATSADGHANTVSAAANVVSARLVSVSAELASLVQIASLAATSADGHAAAASARATSVSAELVSLLASASATLEAHIVAASAAATSVLNIHNTLSAGLGAPQFKAITAGAQAIATATFTKVSGLSLSIAGSGTYEVHGQLIWSQSGAGSASAIFNFGMSMTAQPTMAMFRMVGNTQNLVASANAQQTQFAGISAISATPSIMYSAKISAVSGSVTNTMFFDGILTGSTVQSQLKVVVATSTGAFGVAIQPGSYIRAFKII